MNTRENIDDCNRYCTAKQAEALGRLNIITNLLPGALFQFRMRPDGTFCMPYASEIIRDIYRVSPESLEDDASAVFAAVHPEDITEHLSSIHESAKTLTQWTHEYRLKFEGEQDIWLYGTAIPQLEEDGAVSWQGIITNITDRKRDEDKIRLAISVFKYISEGIMITDPNGRIVDVNETFVSITNYSREEVIGKHPSILSSGRHNKEFYASMWKVLIEKGYWCNEIWNKRKNGDIYAERLAISAVLDKHGLTKHYVALFSDITERIEQESMVKHIAYYDTLTNLPNRALLTDRLNQGMAQAHRRNQKLAVVYLDLDGFKRINDLHGHDVGDRLLVTIAARLKQVLREGDTLARIGGDEFVGVFLDIGDINSVDAMLRRLLEVAANQITVNDLALQISVSLGVTFYPDGHEELDADQLLRKSDHAMYQAKLSGKNRYHIFDSTQDNNIRNQHLNLECMRRSLNSDEFLLYYQPKVNMRTGTVVGVEALIRWQHPQKGLLLPVHFLKEMEDQHMSVEIGEWVIKNALTQIESWHKAGLNISVSVNISAKHLQRKDFVDRLNTLLASHPNRIASIELEILETSALVDMAQVKQVIEECRDIGVKFSLDDFGTGYSSLTYLKWLPVSSLKIDQTFVRDMLVDPDDLAILKGIISMASAFQRDVVAEGVETIEHGEMLLHLGCVLGQGYGIAHPMPARNVLDWVKNWVPDTSWV